MGANSLACSLLVYQLRLLTTLTWENLGSHECLGELWGGLNLTLRTDSKVYMLMESCRRPIELRLVFLRGVF